jgi:hypothetical protein
MEPGYNSDSIDSFVHSKPPSVLDCLPPIVLFLDCLELCQNFRTRDPQLYRDRKIWWVPKSNKYCTVITIVGRASRSSRDLE